jgi:acetyltransferase
VHRPVISPEPYGHMAIHPYPANLTTSSYLQDGSELIIRPIMPEDAEYLQSFFKALSPEAKYFRFMQRFEELSPQMLMRFTQIDYSREMALVALVKEAGVTKQIGVARYVINPDGKTCEFAIAVSDEKQKQGIGSQLMQKLLDIARKRGLTMMEGAVLANNTRMLGLMKALNFTIQTASYDPSIKQVEYWF